MPSTCKGCGARIIWAETPEGKKIPLDPRPRVYAVLKECASESGLPTALEQPAMVTHFATCPKANDFSGSRNRGRDR